MLRFLFPYLYDVVVPGGVNQLIPLGAKIPRKLDILIKNKLGQADCLRKAVAGILHCQSQSTAFALVDNHIVLTGPFIYYSDGLVLNVIITVNINKTINNQHTSKLH